jgi:serine/threonine protein kinase
MIMEQSQQPSPEYAQIKVIRRLAKARSSVYLVQDNRGSQYAMKMFSPEPSGMVSRYYLNEKAHKHNGCQYVTKNLTAVDEIGCVSDGKTVKMSCLIMEYAPNGDMFDLLVNTPVFKNETLIRTYFHQLVSGLEYLHSNNIAHLDLKLENLLLGIQMELKITDFDLSSSLTNPDVKGNGTYGFRAPELISKQCEDLKAADIYSAGIILFVLKTGGKIPHSEGKKVNDIDLSELMYEDPESFWDQHGMLNPNVSFDEDFKSLFMMMTRRDPRSRLTLEEVKQSSWFREPVYTNQEEFIQALRACFP